MNNDNSVFIIASIIYLSRKPLSYAAVRSVYTPEERALQTVNTINSIRENAPGAKIILLESGLQCQLPHNLSSLADQYIYIGDKKIVRFACDGPFKGFGEIISLLQIQKHLDREKDYFKISGRYYLNGNFKAESWADGDFNFHYRSPSSVSTVVYKVRGRAKNIWKAALLLTVPFCFINRSIENVMFRFIPAKKIRKIEQIGVSGLIAVGGDLFTE